MTDIKEIEKQNKRKYYILLLSIIILQLANFTTKKDLKTSSIEFKLHFGIQGFLFWAISALFIWVAKDIFKKYSKRYYFLAYLSIVIGIIIMSFPIYAYREIVKSENISNVLQKQADSLRKMGK